MVLVHQMNMISATPVFLFLDVRHFNSIFCKGEKCYAWLADHQPVIFATYG